MIVFSVQGRENGYPLDRRVLIKFTSSEVGEGRECRIMQMESFFITLLRIRFAPLLGNAVCSDF